ncbi:retrovirus-related pol polyprotein from transposon TNT 1-94 [Tanacetum coccineum]
MIQRGLQAQVITVRTDRGTEFLNKTLQTYFKEYEINQQTKIARTPKQNDIVKRWNHTLVEAARTMLSPSKLPLFFWVEAIAIACYTHNRSLIIPRHEKTPYHIINEREPTLKFLHILDAPATHVESFSHNIDTSNMHTFCQRHRSDYHWTRDHPLEQVCGNPSKQVQTKRQIATDLKLCMFALPLSTDEAKNIKEAMVDHAWIEAMQEELNQFDRLSV